MRDAELKDIERAEGLRWLHSIMGLSASCPLALRPTLLAVWIIWKENPFFFAHDAVSDYREHMMKLVSSIV